MEISLQILYLRVPHGNIFNLFYFFFSWMILVLPDLRKSPNVGDPTGSGAGSEQDNIIVIVPYCKTFLF
jgi:hypothetical protein